MLNCSYKTQHRWIYQYQQGWQYFCTGEKEFWGDKGSVLWYSMECRKLGCFCPNCKRLEWMILVWESTWQGLGGILPNHDTLINLVLLLRMNMRWLSLRVVGWWRGKNILWGPVTVQGLWVWECQGERNPSPLRQRGWWLWKQKVCLWMLLKTVKLVTFGIRVKPYPFFLPIEQISPPNPTCPMRPLQSTLVGKSHPPCPKA